MSEPSHADKESDVLKLAKDYIALRRTLLDGGEVLRIARAFVQAEESRATNARLLDEALQRLNSTPSAGVRRDDECSMQPSRPVVQQEAERLARWLEKTAAGYDPVGPEYANAAAMLRKLSGAHSAKVRMSYRCCNGFEQHDFTVIAERSPVRAACPECGVAGALVGAEIASPDRKSDHG